MSRAPLTDDLIARLRELLGCASEVDTLCDPRMLDDPPCEDCQRLFAEFEALFAEALAAASMNANTSPNDQGCRLPPEGWWCSREPGHDGPCAARRITANDDAKWLRLWRSVSGPHAELTGPLIRFAALAAASRQERLYTNDEMLKVRADAHGDGQLHAIADVNAGLVDDLIAPRLAAASRPQEIHDSIVTNQPGRPVAVSCALEGCHYEFHHAAYNAMKLRAEAAEATNASPAAPPPWRPMERVRTLIAEVIASDATPFLRHNERSSCVWCGAKWTPPNWQLDPQPELFGHPENGCLVFASLPLPSPPASKEPKA